MIKGLKTGEWVTTSRLRIYPRLFLAVFVAIALIVVVFRTGTLDAARKPLGTDFLSFWSASNLLWQGRPEAAYDHSALMAIEQSVAGPDAPLYTWLYPPMAFLVVAPLAMLSYLPSLLAWSTLTWLGYLTALWRLLPDRRALLAMLAFPAAFINLGHGQNGFLSAALLGWGLMLVPKRPWLGGALLGLLVYKPQLGLLLPLALAAAGYWRAILSATLTVMTSAMLTWMLWGTEVWSAFLAKSGYSLQMLQEGLVPWHKMISTFAAARLLGASVSTAWMFQIAVGSMVALAVWWIWRGGAPYLVKIAVLATGTLLVAPLALDYDATLIGLALAALVADGLQRGFLNWEISILAFAWLTPFAWRPLTEMTDIPFGWMTVLLLAWAGMRRCTG